MGRAGSARDSGRTGLKQAIFYGPPGTGKDDPGTGDRQHDGGHFIMRSRCAGRVKTSGKRWRSQERWALHDQGRFSCR